MRKVPKDRNLPFNAHLSLVGCGALALAIGFCAETAQAAIVLSDPLAAVGQWDMSLADSNRSCRMTLRNDPAASRNAVSMPAGCRRSLPILAKVDTYGVPRADHIALADQAGTPVLDFAEDTTAARSFIASGPEGETYHLVAINVAFLKNGGAETTAPSPKAPGFEVAQAKPATTTPTTTAVPSRIAAAVKPSDLAGRYAVLRDGTKDTGCMVTLDDHARAAKGGMRATLAPACRDQGIVIFDPMGWQLVAGRMVLTARKGHTTHLDLQPDNTWAKDPKEGKGLSLKKL